MSRLVELKIEDRIEYVSELKVDYIKNIIEQAKKCKYIDKIVLFGSSIEERCSEESDIDIAVFLNKPEKYVFATKAYNNFQTEIYKYNNFNSTYDILCFQNTKIVECELIKNIERGIRIYERY